MHQTDVCSSSGGSIDTTTSSTTTTDPPPRRSNSHHRSKKSIVTTLSSAIFAASAPMSAAPITRSNSSSALALSESEIRELEEPWRYTPPPPELTDPLLFKPVDGGVRPTIVWRYCTMRGWVTKHIPPSYSFTKSKKERYVILADRMLYAFKTDTPSAHFKEVFELTKETNVFVTDQFTGVLYCIEITKRSEELRSWYIQCETAELMKTWLDRLKRTVQWLREERPGIVTLKGLGEIQTENDALENKRNGSTDDLSPPLSPTAHAAHHHHYHHRPPSSPHLTSSTLSSSDGSVDTRRHDSVASDQSDTTIQTKMLAQQQQQQQANILGSYYSDYYDWQSSVASSASVHVSPSSSSLSSMSTYHSSHQAQHHQPLYAPYDQAPLPARRNTSPAVQYHHHQQHHHVLPPRNLPPQLPPPRSALPPPPPQYQKYYYS